MQNVTFHLRSTDKLQVDAWRAVFGKLPNFEISHGDWFSKDFANTFEKFDAVVSPANSFGFMGGGIDLPLRRHFRGVEERVKTMIKRDHAGELIVGMSDYVFTETLPPRLIVCPTVRTARTDASKTVNAYLAFKGLLSWLKDHPEVKRVLVPGMCSGVAGMPAFRSAIQMLFAWKAFHGEKMPQNDIVCVMKIFDSPGEEGMNYNDLFMRSISHPF